MYGGVRYHCRRCADQGYQVDWPVPDTEQDWQDLQVEWYKHNKEHHGDDGFVPPYEVTP